MAAMLPFLLIGYIALAVAFIAVAWKAPARSKWLGLASIAAAAPFFLWLGSFAEPFDAGQCYSRALGMIATSVERTDAPAELGQRIRSLPLHGYETSCAEVEAAARELPNAKAP
jgi:hypothetical protein